MASRARVRYLAGTMSNRPSILVVEDDDDCRMVLADLLEMSGYSVISCGEAHRAVELAKESAPALVLVDFMMPDADGGWLVRSLRAQGGALAEVPVVLTDRSIRLVLVFKIESRLGSLIRVHDAPLSSVR